jgi:hypothetical protein
MEAALRSRLLTAPGLAAATADRWSWVERPQEDSLPAGTLQTVGGALGENFDGFDGVRRAVVQLDFWSLSHVEAVALREAAITALAAPAVVEGIRFDRGHFSAPRDLGEPTDTGFIHRQSIDVTFHFQAHQEG